MTRQPTSKRDKNIDAPPDVAGTGSTDRLPSRQRLLDAMPVSERRIDLAGVSTAVLEGGDGPPIVLLHGQGEFAALWIRVVPELARTNRVVLADLPGHGASEITGGALDTAAVLRWLDQLIAHTCSTEPVLAGHLLGGAIAARYAAAHGARLAHLVLVDTLGLSWFRPAPSFAVPMVGYVARPSERSRDRLFDRCFLDFDQVGVQTGQHWNALLEYALECGRTPSTQAALRRLMPRMGVPPIGRAELARIACPTTLIHGRHGLQVRLDVAETAAARYGWPLHIIEDTRDDPAVEQPGAFLTALRAAIGTGAKR